MLYEGNFHVHHFQGFLLVFITSRNRGGGHKRLYRKIDFKRDKLGVISTVFSVEYDPNRNARIVLLVYRDGEKRYILHCFGLTIGSSVISDFDAPIVIGNSLRLFYFYFISS